MTTSILCTAVFAVSLGLPLEALPDGPCQKSAATELTKGVREFKEAQYPEAAIHFKSALDLDKSCTTARLYLGTTYLQQYVPGTDSPDGLAMAASARAQFDTVLEEDPKNELAIASIASLCFNQRKLDEAESWYRRLITVSPKNKEAFYTLGVIVWARAYKPFQEAREKSGMREEDPGPLKDEGVRQELRARYFPLVQEGFDNLERALALDAEYDDAMAYLYLMWRLKGDMEDSPQACKEDIDRANDWFMKVIETRKAKASRPARR